MKCGDRGTHNATENDVYIALPHASVPRAIRIARVIPPNRRSERLVLTQLRWTGRPGPQLLPISLRYWKRNVETDVDCRNCDNANH